MRSYSSKPELLAPAGGPEPFYAALAAGADAIYCGMGSFNARRKADNFTDETFEAACRAAHLAGARVYVTVNIVIKEEEMSQALALVERCWRLGADAFIIQDWGCSSRSAASCPRWRRTSPRRRTFTTPAEPPGARSQVRTASRSPASFLLTRSPRSTTRWTSSSRCSPTAPSAFATRAFASFPASPPEALG